MSARKDLAAALVPLLPKKWQVIDHDRNLDKLAVIAVLVSQRRIEPAPNAQGSHKGTFRVFIIDPHTDVAAAEDALDDGVDTLLYALDGVQAVRWTNAEKVIYQDFRAYQITLEAFTERKD
ncbi:hypothetical protein [Agromyces laixinhei]|uniref:hypothetical protein n=1 Tax=Agromyces laixinhei TaxID=2585717 RepID=UPI0012ED6497|nr:hypothetical protein [Agromyces laixinhei]